MKYIYQKLILFICFSVIIISCSKDENNSISTSTTTCNLYSYSDCKLKIIENIYNASASMKHEFSYNNSDKVEEIQTIFIAQQDTSITNYIFHYSQGKITGFTRYWYNNGLIDTIIGSITYIDGLIQKVDLRLDDNSWYEFQYDINGKVIKVSDISNGETFKSSTFTYNNNCNISEEIYYNGTSTLLKYEDYDDKKNPYRAINLPDAIIYSFDIGWPFTQNNILSESFNYQYNLNDFPETLEFTNGEIVYFTYDCN